MEKKESRCGNENVVELNEEEERKKKEEEPRVGEGVWVEGEED
jgi:hypothetical protein